MSFPPPLVRARNLADLPSDATALANLLPVSARGPTGRDNSPAYTVGQSMWAEPGGQLSLLQGLLPSGTAMWTPTNNPGNCPGAVVSGAVGIFSTQRSFPTWTGNLIRVIRATDPGTFLDIKVLPNNKPDLSSLGAFLAPTGGIGYCSILYDQSGGGNDIAIPIVAAMPRIDMASIVDGNLPLEVDSTRRAYWLAMGPVGDGRWPVTWSSGTTVTLTLLGAVATGSITGTTATLTAPVGADNGFWRKGLILSGTNVTAGTTLVDSQVLTDALGSGTWTVSPTQSVASSGVTITGKIPSVPPDLLPGNIVSSFTTPTSIPTAVFTATIAGTTMTIVSVTSGTVTAGMQLAGGPIFSKIVSNISGSGVGSTWTIADSQTVSVAATFNGNTTVVSVNYTTGDIVLSCAPTANPGQLVFAVQPVYLDAPDTLQVPWRSWGGVLGACLPNNTKPFMFGTKGQAAFNNAASFSGPITPGIGLPYGFRIFNGNSVGSTPLRGGTMPSTPTVTAFSTGGTNGRDLNWRYDTAVGSESQFTGTVPAQTLSGAAIGYHNQLSNLAVGTRTTADWLLYDLILYPFTLTPQNIADISASIQIARGWAPQVADAYSCDGSSTTFGAGTVQVQAWGQQFGRRLLSVKPMTAYVEPQGGTIEGGWGNFGLYCGQVPAAKRDLLFVHFGLGNSLQAGGSFTATGQSGATINVSNTITTLLSGLGVQISGTNIPAGAFTVAFTSTSITLNVAPTGTVTTFSVLPDTAQVAWNNIVSYCANALTFGYRGIVIIGSASRKSFSLGAGGSLDQFNTVKCYLREAAMTIPGVVGYVDWEDDPYMGSDGAGMVVTDINGSTVTVNAASSCVAVGNRVRWSGMLGANRAAIQAQINANTGGQYFATVGGNTFTVTGPLTGLAVGNVIQAVSPAPWSTWPGEAELGEFGLNPDGQHFCRKCYWRQGDTVAQYALDNSLV